MAYCQLHVHIVKSPTPEGQMYLADVTSLADDGLSHSFSELPRRRIGNSVLDRSPTQ